MVENHLAPITELFVPYDSAQKMKTEAANLVSHDLSPRQICDLELLMNGGFNPLKGFLGKCDYDSVLTTMRLKMVLCGRFQSRLMYLMSSPKRLKLAKTSRCEIKKA